jgi:hypothetical protein
MSNFYIHIGVLHHFNRNGTNGEMRPTLPIFPREKRTAFDALGRSVECELLPDWEVLVGARLGPVKLLNGVEGRTGGFGLEHIQAKPDRIKQIASFGFATVHAYVRFVLDQVTHMGFQQDGRMVLIREDGRQFHHIICQWDPALSIWSITTAIPKRNMRDVVVSWKRAAR